MVIRHGNSGDTLVPPGAQLSTDRRFCQEHHRQACAPLTLTSPAVAVALGRLADRARSGAFLALARKETD